MFCTYNKMTLLSTIRLTCNPFPDNFINRAGITYLLTYLYRTLITPSQNAAKIKAIKSVLKVGHRFK